MSYISKFSKLAVIPVKKCLAFEADQCFMKVRSTLEETGIKWTELINNTNSHGGSYRLPIPKMDSIFFHDDRFEILIDVKGFAPEEIKCTITTDNVEVLAEKRAKLDRATRTMVLKRNYFLPQPVLPTNGICCLSTEGLLLVSAPWS